MLFSPKQSFRKASRGAKNDELSMKVLTGLHHVDEFPQKPHLLIADRNVGIHRLCSLRLMIRQE